MGSQSSTSLGHQTGILDLLGTFTPLPNSLGSRSRGRAVELLQPKPDGSSRVASPRSAGAFCSELTHAASERPPPKWHGSPRCSDGKLFDQSLQFEGVAFHLRQDRRRI